MTHCLKSPCPELALPSFHIPIQLLYSNSLPSMSPLVTGFGARLLHGLVFLSSMHVLPSFLLS